MRKPEVSKGKNCLSSLPTELQLGIVRHMPRLPTICRLNKHWHSVRTGELLRRLLAVPPEPAQRAPPSLYEQGFKSHWKMSDPWHSDYEGILSYYNRYRFALRDWEIPHFINTNNVDALRHLLDFMAGHPYSHPPTVSLLLGEPASLRARVAEGEEKRFFLSSHGHHYTNAAPAAFKYNDMSCTQLLIDHGLADYRALLKEAVYDDFHEGKWFARPFPGSDSRGGHNSVLDWLLAYPPHHVVQAILVMWGLLPLHDRLLPLCNWRSGGIGPRHDDMLTLAAGHGHSASLQVIGELRMMVKILMDDATFSVIPETRQPLSRALRIARGIASMWPGTLPLVAEYLLSVCTWEGQSSSSDGRGSNGNSNSKANSPPPLLALPLPLPPRDPVLQRPIDLKTYYEMLEPENWPELGRMAPSHRPLPWLVLADFLGDEEAARRMRCFKRSLRELRPASSYTRMLLLAASAFRR